MIATSGPRASHSIVGHHPTPCVVATVRSCFRFGPGRYCSSWQYVPLDGTRAPRFPVLSSDHGGGGWLSKRGRADLWPGSRTRWRSVRDSSLTMPRPSPHPLLDVSSTSVQAGPVTDNDYCSPPSLPPCILSRCVVGRLPPPPLPCHVASQRPINDPLQQPRGASPSPAAGRSQAGRQRRLPLAPPAVICCRRGHRCRRWQR